MEIRQDDHAPVGTTLLSTYLRYFKTILILGEEQIKNGLFYCDQL